MIIIQRILLFLKRRGIKVLKNALINNLRKKQFSVRDKLDTGAKELLSGVSVRNPPYPPIHRVVKDLTTSEDTGQREGNNPCYPSIHQAVSDQRAPDTDQQKDSLNIGTNNPQYPPIHQLVRDQPAPKDTGWLLLKEDSPSGGEGKNPSYPSVHQAVSGQRTPDTGQQEDSSGTDKNNLQYPPIHQAVRGQRTPENIGQLLFREEPPQVKNKGIQPILLFTRQLVTNTH